MKNDILSVEKQDTKIHYIESYLAYVNTLQHIPAEDWQVFNILLNESIQDWKHTGGLVNTEKTARTIIDITGNIKEQINDFIQVITERRNKKFINVDVNYKFISARYTDNNGIEHNYI